MIPNSLRRLANNSENKNDPKAISVLTDSSDKQRQFYVLSILLSGFIFLGTAGFVVTLINYINHKTDYFFRLFAGESVFFLLIFFFVWLRKKYQYFVSWGLIGLLFIPALCIAIYWGPLLVQPLLLFILIITISGILISARAVLLSGGIVACLLVGITYLHVNNIVLYDKSWFTNVAHVYDLRDAVVAAVSIAIIAILSWLSNRQIEYSLKKVRESEKALIREKDLLDLRVKERTKELQIAQLGRLEQINRFASFGRLSSGIIHNIVNPLTAVSYVLQNVHRSHASAQSSELKEVLRAVDTAIEDVKLMEQIVDSVRMQYQNQEKKGTFFVKQEIQKVIIILGYKAKHNFVNFKLDIDDGLTLFVDQVKFHQVIANLVSNGIDAYPGDSNVNTPREVIISAKKQGSFITIQVKDYGIGISDRNLKYIFSPLFTTKTADCGTGIGLYLCKQIIERNFFGTISVKSNKKSGTVFSVTLPIENQNGQ